MKNLSTISALKGANTSELLWNPSEGGINFQLVNGIPQKEFGILQKELNVLSMKNLSTIRALY